MLTVARRVSAASGGNGRARGATTALGWASAAGPAQGRPEGDRPALTFSGKSFQLVFPRPAPHFRICSSPPQLQAVPTGCSSALRQRRRWLPSPLFIRLPCASAPPGLPSAADTRVRCAAWRRLFAARRCRVRCDAPIAPWSRQKAKKARPLTQWSMGPGQTVLLPPRPILVFRV